MDFEFKEFKNKDILLFCGPKHLFDSTSFFLMKKLSKNAKKLIIVADKFTIKKIPNDIKNSYQINCAWWDLSSLFSNLKFHDKELLSQCCFDYVFTPLPIFPILNAITHNSINKRIMVFIYEQGKPNISMKSFKKDFEIRDKIRVVKIIKKLKFDFLQYNLFFNFFIDFLCKTSLRIKEYLNYFDLQKNSFRVIPKPLFNPYSGKYNFSNLKKFKRNILNSSLVIQWNHIDSSFYKSIGFNNLKVIDHPAKEFILEKKDSNNVVLGIYPTEMTIENYKKLNVNIIDVYIRALKRLINKFNVNKIRIKLKPNVINSDFSYCLSEEIDNLKIKQLTYEIIDSQLGIIESLQYDDIILGDFSSCLWLASNIFSKKIFVLDELNLIQVDEMLNYEFINRVSEI